MNSSMGKKTLNIEAIANELQRSHGLDEADRRFCQAVVELLAPPREKSATAL